MIWVLGKEPHPLRAILCGHLRELTQHHWGYPDFTWVTTTGDSKVSLGSEAWRNICKAWAYLKPCISPCAPRNMEE